MDPTPLSMALNPVPPAPEPEPAPLTLQTLPTGTVLEQESSGYQCMLTDRYDKNERTVVVLNPGTTRCRTGDLRTIHGPGYVPDGRVYRVVGCIGGTC